MRYAASRCGGDNQQGDGGRRGRNHGSRRSEARRQDPIHRTPTRRAPTGAGSESERASGSDSLTDITREEWAAIAEVATDPPDLATTTFEVDLVRYVTDEQAPPDSIALTGVTETPVRPSPASDSQKQGNATAPNGCQGSPATLFDLATVAVAARGYQREPPPRMAVCPLLDAPFWAAQEGEFLSRLRGAPLTLTDVTTERTSGHSDEVAETKDPAITSSEEESMLLSPCSLAIAPLRPWLVARWLQRGRSQTRKPAAKRAIRRTRVLTDSEDEGNAERDEQPQPSPGRPQKAKRPRPLSRKSPTSRESVLATSPHRAPPAEVIDDDDMPLFERYAGQQSSRVRHRHRSLSAGRVAGKRARPSGTQSDGESPGRGGPIGLDQRPEPTDTRSVSPTKSQPHQERLLPTFRDDATEQQPAKGAEVQTAEGLRWPVLVERLLAAGRGRRWPDGGRSGPQIA